MRIPVSFERILRFQDFEMSVFEVSRFQNVLKLLSSQMSQFRSGPVSECPWWFWGDFSVFQWKIENIIDFEPIFCDFLPILIGYGLFFTKFQWKIEDFNDFWSTSTKFEWFWTDFRQKIGFFNGFSRFTVDFSRVLHRFSVKNWEFYRF